MVEHIILFQDVSPATWSRILHTSKELDVEEGDSYAHIFDARLDKIYVWGRDGWRKGFYHAYLWFDQDKGHVRVTRGVDPRCMKLTSTVNLLAPLLEQSLGKEEER